jgi:hypothetical protein
LQETAEEIMNFLNASMNKFTKKEESRSLIPFFDYLNSYLIKINPDLDPNRASEINFSIISTIPSMNFSSVILNERKTSQIVKTLPDIYSHRNWNLAYSTEKHGSSLLTFFRETENRGPSILLVMDSKKYVFGAFLSVSWKISRLFYGTGEIFLFSFGQKDKIKSFYATMQNECFVSSNTEGIVFGSE